MAFGLLYPRQPTSRHWICNCHETGQPSLVTGRLHMRARYLSFAIAAVCFLAVGGCAKRTGTAPMAGTTSGGVNTGNPGGMTNPPGSEIIAPRKDTWTFDASPE